METAATIFSQKNRKKEEVEFLEQRLDLLANARDE